MDRPPDDLLQTPHFTGEDTETREQSEVTQLIGDGARVLDSQCRPLRRHAIGALTKPCARNSICSADQLSSRCLMSKARVTEKLTETGQ